MIIGVGTRWVCIGVPRRHSSVDFSIPHAGRLFPSISP